MSRSVLMLGAGLVGGVALTLGLQAALQEPEPKDRTLGDPGVAMRAVTELRAENARLEEQLQEANQAIEKTTREVEELTQQVKQMRKPPVPVEPQAEITEADMEREIAAFAQGLGKIIQGGGQDEIARLQEFVKRGGKPVVDFLERRFEDDTKGFIERLIAAHALAQSGDPEATKKLEATLLDPDSGMLKHRLAAHGLAFSDAEGIPAILSRVAHDDAEDIGARANASFGLARRGLDEGFDLYMKMTDLAFEKKDPAALQYLGGVMILGDKVLPYVHERLQTYKEPQALLMLIETLKAKGDKGAIPALEKLAYDSSRPESVQKAAQAALKVLRAKE